MDTVQPTVIVTGGAGFIGSHVVDLLVERGYRVRVVDSLVAGKREHVNKHASLEVIDIRDFDALLPEFQEASTIIHLAACPQAPYTVEHPLETHNINLTGTLNVLEAARQAGVPRVVYASSSAIYGDLETMPLREDMPAQPVNPYGVHKYAAEQYMTLYATLYGLQTISLRFFNAYGPRLDPNGPYALVIGKFLQCLAEGEPLPVTGDGQQTRDFVYVRDLAQAVVYAAEEPGLGDGDVINVGSGIATSILELAQTLGGTTTFAPPRTEPRHSRADIARARELLGWYPATSLTDGLAQLRTEWQYK
jgi:UDP-glucose 4-epimerase